MKRRSLNFLRIMIMVALAVAAGLGLWLMAPEFEWLSLMLKLTAPD